MVIRPTKIRSSKEDYLEFSKLVDKSKDRKKNPFLKLNSGLLLVTALTIVYVMSRK